MDKEKIGIVGSGSIGIASMILLAHEHQKVILANDPFGPPPMIIKPYPISEIAPKKGQESRRERRKNKRKK
jgi:thioredoxin reductase